MKTLIRNSLPYRLLVLMRECLHWGQRQFSAPSPHYIKQSVLLRNGIPGVTWVETGTYLGQTTRVLSGCASKVYSIEPEPTLFAAARNHFKDCKNVEILNGTSEDVFPRLLPRIDGDVNFWLDGHYSAGTTFKGPQDTPIIDELRYISENLGRFGKVCVLVDDVRCFDPGQPGSEAYPPLDTLVDWARCQGLRWHIEHDIFVAKR